MMRKCVVRNVPDVCLWGGVRGMGPDGEKKDESGEIVASMWRGVLSDNDKIDHTISVIN